MSQIPVPVMPGSMTEEDVPVELYTIDQVCVMFSVKAETIRKWLKENRFPNAKKFGGKNWRIPRQDIVNFVEGTKS